MNTEPGLHSTHGILGATERPASFFLPLPRQLQYGMYNYRTTSMVWYHMYLPYHTIPYFSIKVIPERVPRGRSIAITKKLPPPYHHRISATIRIHGSIDFQYRERGGCCGSGSSNELDSSSNSFRPHTVAQKRQGSSPTS